jgi:hypothetical protein
VPTSGHTVRGRIARSAVALVGFVAAFVAAFSLVFLSSGASAAVSPPDPRPVPDWWGRDLVPAFVGEPAEARPLDVAPLPQHPHLAPNGRAQMHGDGYASGTHPFAAPLGRDPVVRSHARAPIGGECAAVTFDSRGRIVTVCASFSEFTLVVLDPTNLAELARLDLPQRPSTLAAILTLDLGRITSDTSGGAYFFMDPGDRVVLVDAARRLRRIAVVDTPTGVRLEQQASLDLSPWVPSDCFGFDNWFPRGECDAVSSIMPDHDGRYWWVTRNGRVGTTTADLATVRVRALGEEIQNSFSVASDGVYVVSDTAMYGLVAAADGAPVVRWRATYDRGSGTKPGSINQGSGTTPTLLDDGDDRYVAITDNADDRMNVVVYRRDPADATEVTPVCTVPVFTAGASTTDNSLVGVGRTMIVENNFGYRNFLSLLFGGTVPGGITRVDVRPDGSGCDTVWTSAERAPSVVPKVSTRTGLLYVYTKDPGPWFTDAWYVTAIDVATGETRFKVLAGTGWNWDNHWAPITIGPDGTLYAGVLNGIMSLRDGA